MQRLSVTQEHEGLQEGVELPSVGDDAGGFADLGGTPADLDLEGDSSLQVADPILHKFCYSQCV